jgi:hypothetical protein
MTLVLLQSRCYVNALLGYDLNDDNAHFAPFVTFNHGNASTSAAIACSAAEMVLIGDEIARASAITSNGDDRAVRRLGQGPTRALARQKSRSLKLVKCFPLMAWATNKCGGARHTRRRHHRLDDEEDERDSEDEEDSEDEDSEDKGEDEE